jgi:hypothetical protein
VSLFGQGTSPRIKGFPDRKPEQLIPFSSALVAPEWGWFWKRLNTALPLWERMGSPNNLADSNVATLVGSASWDTGKNGVAVDIPGGSGDKITVSGLPTGTNAPFSITMTLNPNSLGAFTNLFFVGDRVTDNGTLCFINNTVDLRFGFWNGTDVDITQPLVVGTTTVVTCTFDGADARLYIDGLLKGGPLSATHSISNSQGHFGASNIVGNEWDGPIFSIYVHERVLTDTECFLIGRTPFGPFHTSVRPLFLPTAVATLDVAQMLSPTPRWDNRMRFY